MSKREKEESKLQVKVYEKQMQKARCNLKKAGIIEEFNFV